MSQYIDGSMNTGRVQRPIRSKNACLTCRRRRVRCNEQRPRCNHCERLNLQCAWRPGANSNLTPVISSVAESQPPPSSSEQHVFDTSYNALNTWDFNDIIWQDTSALNPGSLDWITEDRNIEDRTSTSLTITQPDGAVVSPSINTSERSSIVPFHSSIGLTSPVSPSYAEGHALVEHFLASMVPPILASVEVGPRWTSTKMLFASLANASNMVRYAIMAFSALQIGIRDETSQTEHKALYDKGAEQFLSYMKDAHKDQGKVESDLQYALATGFFLSYDALLTNRVNEAQSLLKDATSLIRIFRTKKLTLVEKRLISWIRLVDGRASSAGGDGAFLVETESDAYSPVAHEKPFLAERGSVSIVSNTDSEIEEVLFDILYTPGLVFYQRVQSIMARVSNIDPWHRSRGTVKDETEVMVLAEAIRQDLLSLEKQRPALTDYAVAGTLTERHLTKHIAAALTRSYRTYWANYEAGFIHLHRVAHRHLPATAEVIRARHTIKDVTRLLEESDEPLPVNFIWPLLMACCEEENIDDRTWMITAIRNMQSVASNAKPIADVLEEVHRRQDATKQRVDVRQTSMDLFNMSFAVV